MCIRDSGKVKTSPTGAITAENSGLTGKVVFFDASGYDGLNSQKVGIMNNIFHAAYDASVEVGKPGDLMVGANVAGFLKVAAAMMAQGV